MKIHRALTEGERPRLSAALMNQARLERRLIPSDVHNILLHNPDDLPLERIEKSMEQNEARTAFFESFALMIARGNIVIESDLTIPPLD